MSASLIFGPILAEEAEGLTGQVHLVANVGLHCGGDVAERAVGDCLVADVDDLLLEGEHEVGRVFFGADEVLEFSIGVLQDGAGLDVVIEGASHLCGDGGEGLDLTECLLRG